MATLYWSKLLQPKRFREQSSVKATASDNRSPFKKDFDTVCNSTILRRLQDKAQVFPLEQEDYARTRLTHSIEVMSVAESLGVQAENIIRGANKKYWGSTNKQRAIGEEYIKNIPTILKTVALLHDMGNPPFGHLGEKIIGDWFEKHLPNLYFNSDKKLVFGTASESDATLGYMFKGRYAEDLKHFEGNAQLFRLVTKLSLVVDHNGMNLTFPVMASFIKYPTASDKVDKSHLLTKKIGFFASKENLFLEINKVLGLNNCRHPLAFLLEAADDIAYLTADIEDAHRKGLISLREIRDYLLAVEDPLVSKVVAAMEEYEKQAKEMSYEDVEDYVVHRSRVLIKGLMIDAMNDAFKDAYESIMTGTFNNELIAVSSAKRIAEVLRKIEKENIYYCPSILENKTRAIAVITKLLEAYIPAIVNWSEDNDKDTDSENNLLYLSLSTNYRHICKKANEKYAGKSNLSDDDRETMIYNKILLVTDQISGMTDTHALTVYRMLTAN